MRLKEVIEHLLAERLSADVSVVEIIPLGSAGPSSIHKEGFKKNRLVTCIIEGEYRNFILKSLPEDGETIGEMEGVFTLLRAKRFAENNPGQAQCMGFIASCAGKLTAFDDVDDILLIEEFIPGELLATKLAAIQDGLLAQSDALRLVNLLAEYLTNLHAKPVSHSFMRPYVRQLLGGDFGLIATLDAYPPSLREARFLEEILELGLSWRRRLLDVRVEPCRIHGDFHPWNIFITDGQQIIRTTGGMHTTGGLPTDDLAALGVNFFVIALETTGQIKESFRVLHREFLNGYACSAEEKVKITIGETLPWFYAHRILVLANPIYYPARTLEDQRRLFAIASALLGTSTFGKDDWAAGLEEYALA